MDIDEGLSVALLGSKSAAMRRGPLKSTNMILTLMIRILFNRESLFD